MFLIGVMFAFTQHKNVLYHVKKGILIFLSGYALNFFRGTLPIYIGLHYGKLTASDVGDMTPLKLLIEIDFLQIAGIMIIVLAIINHVIKNKLILLPFIVAVLTVSPFLEIIKPTTKLTVYISELFQGNSEYTDFRIIPWIAYAMAGMVYGSLYLHLQDKDKFIKFSAITGAILFVITIPFFFLGKPYSMYKLSTALNIFRNSSIGVVSLTGFTMLWIAFAKWLLGKVNNELILQRLYSWSEHITIFYILQWIAIGWYSIDFFRYSIYKFYVLCNFNIYICR